MFFVDLEPAAKTKKSTNSNICKTPKYELKHRVSKITQYNALVARTMDFPRPAAENITTASIAENLMTVKHEPSLKIPQPHVHSVTETILQIIRDAQYIETSRPNDLPTTR
jgi:hypothetical protein